MIAGIVFVFCALLGAAQARTDGKESVRIYVFTAPPAEGTSSDDVVQGRLAAVRDLRDAIRHKAGLSVVDDRSLADIIVEVTEREQQSLGEGGYGGARLTPLVGTTIRLRVTAGQRETEMKGTGTGTGARAAKDAADRLLKWIARNRMDR